MRQGHWIGLMFPLDLHRLRHHQRHQPRRRIVTQREPLVQAPPRVQHPVLHALGDDDALAVVLGEAGRDGGGHLPAADADEDVLAVGLRLFEDRFEEIELAGIGSGGGIAGHAGEVGGDAEFAVDGGIDGTGNKGGS